MSANGEKSRVRGTRAARCLGTFSGLWPGCVNSGNIRLERTRGFECLHELLPAPADNFVSRSRASREELVSATAWPASAGPGVYSRRWPVSPLPSRSSAPRPNTFGSAIKAPASPSGSARFVARPSSTPKTVTVRLSVSPWARLRTRTFQRHGCLSMTAADTRGCNCRRTRGLSPRTLFESRHRSPASSPAGRFRLPVSGESVYLKGSNACVAPLPSVAANSAGGAPFSTQASSAPCQFTCVGASPPPQWSMPGTTYSR